MIKITYKESSIECSTTEEAKTVLLLLNDIRRENALAKHSPCSTTVVVPEAEKRETIKDANQRVFEESRKPKPRVV